MSLKAFPTDFLKYLLSCALCLPINAMAIDGFSLKNGRVVQILNPSVTARITFGLSSFSHSSMSGKDASYPLYLQTSSKAIASISCTRQFLSILTDHLTPTDKAFLLGFEDGTPDWDASEYRDFLHYPSVQWKLLNIRKLKEKNPQKHKDSISKLQKYLAL